MIARIVTMYFKEERVDDFLNLFARYAERIAGCPGCKMLNLIQDKTHKNVISTYSIWESESALDQYRNSELFGQVWPQTKVFFSASPQATTYELIHRFEA